MSRQTKAHNPSKRAFGSSSPSPAFGAFSTPASTLSYLAKPPDFSSISDANVVVSLKSLLKKDSATKERALDDLVTYVQGHPYEQDGGAEEALLEAWVCITDTSHPHHG
jgi:hypothetical protein